MSKLLIVESPTKAKHIRHMLGSGWEVKATIGHIRDMPLQGDAAYVRPPDFKVNYEIQASKKDTVKDLQRAAQSAESVYIATDPDREGEAIAWHVCQVLKIKPSTAQRVSYQEVTETAIRKAIAKPRPVNMRLVAAQETRRALDRMVGWEVSGPLSRAVGSKSSAGRVQSPALALIVARERAIKAFKPTNWYQVIAHIAGKQDTTWRAVWLDGTKEGEYFQDQAHAKALAAALPGLPLKVIRAETKPVRRAPSPPFTTSSMQMDGARALKAPVDDIMKAAQSLFDHGHITYHRTDSPNLSEEGEGLLRAALTKANLPLVEKPRRWKSKGDAQEAHEAIRPTRPLSETAGENALEQALYDLIRKRAMASQMPDAVYQQTSCTLDAGTFQSRPAQFRAVGSVLTDPGWMALYQESSEDEEDGKDTVAANPVPKLFVGDAVRAVRGELANKKTKAPPRYTESTLIKALEDHGVGRPSTYASIIKTLYARDYMRRKGKAPPLYSTVHGEEVADVLQIFGFSQVDYTRGIESQLDEITEGKVGPRDVLRQCFADLESTLHQMPAEAAGLPCPIEGCGGTVTRRESRKRPGAFFWACSNRDAHGLLSDENGQPGKPFGETAVANSDGPVCPDCGAATGRYETRNGHGYFRCGKGHGAWWDDKGSLGKKLEDRAPSGGAKTAKRGSAGQKTAAKGAGKARPRSTIMD